MRRVAISLWALGLATAACSAGGPGGDGPLYGDGSGASPDGGRSASAVGSGDGGRTTTTGAPPASDGGTVGPALDGGAGTEAAAPPADPCPSLPIPGTAYNRNVVFREWSATATGDGSYFASQAPFRLGFNRLHGNVWIVKFRTEANTYFGRISAGADSTAAITWISDSPTDPTIAVKNNLVSYGTHGVGTVDFVVVRDAADAARIATEPAFAGLRGASKLEGDHCYYVGFENVAGVVANPLTASYWSSAPDDCGTQNGTPDCYYLGIDFNHTLHVVTTGQTVAGNVIAGLTH